MKKMIITAVGRDKVGIVAKLTNIIFSFKGNINNSKMIRLENYFTMMISITIPNSKQNNLLKTLQKNESIEIKTIDTDAFSATPKNIYQIKLVGENREGYVFMLTNYLTKKKINIETIYSKEKYITNYRVIFDSFKILIIFIKIIINIRQKYKKIHK